jgi:hypothetical protein
MLRRAWAVGALAWLVLWSTAGVADDAKGGRYALLVGVQKYDPNELRELKYSEADIEELAKVLLDSGYEETNVVRMTLKAGTENPRFLPDGDRIRKELALLLQNKSEEDVVLLGFAGHGVQFAGEQGSYFCPQDAKLGDPATLISFAEVYKQLEECKAGLKVLLVDACRNDPQADNSRSAGDADVNSVSMPQLTPPPGGIVAFFSCSAGQKAFEHDEIKHGVFFHYVIQGLQGAAAPKGGASVTFDDLLPFVKRRVNDYARAKYGWPQLPESVGTSRGVMPIVAWKAKPAPVPGGSADPRVDGLAKLSLNSPVGEYEAAEYTATQKKIARVIAFRRLTDNKLADEKQTMEPTIAKISADGSRIAFWCPASGLWTIRPDGSQLTQVFAQTATPEQRGLEHYWLELSPDGNTIYYQVFGSGIHRVNWDGKDARLLIAHGYGSEYEPIRVREEGRRIFYSRRDGIYSIDTYGNGDKRTYLNAQILLQHLDARDLMCGGFDVNEMGSRLVALLWHPRLMRMQAFAMYTDGSGFRHLVDTPFQPSYLTMSPDGEQVVFWGQDLLPYAVNWDGSNYRPLPIPGTGHNQAGANRENLFSWDGRWLNTYSGGGPQITQLDGTGRFEPFHGGPGNAWAGAYMDGFFTDWYLGSFTRDMRRFVFISHAIYRQRPRQLIVGDLNPDPALTKDLPKITEVSFPNRLSTDQSLPNHIGPITAKIVPGVEKVEYMHALLSPVVQATGDPNRPWDWERGWTGLEGDHVLRDDGDPKRGDAAAGDGVWSGQVIPHYYNKPLPGKYPVRIVAHTPKTAVIVDVDGVNIK